MNFTVMRGAQPHNIQLRVIVGVMPFHLPFATRPAGQLEQSAVAQRIPDCNVCGALALVC